MITIKRLEINCWHDGRLERYDVGKECYLLCS